MSILLHVYLCTMFKERALDPLELEVQKVVSHFVDAGN